MSNKFYEWWKNHRKVLTYGAFIILFGFYLSPVVKEAKYKNQCIKYSTKGALIKFDKDDIGETLLEDIGLNIDELAKIEAKGFGISITTKVEKGESPLESADRLVSKEQRIRKSRYYSWVKSINEKTIN